MYKAIRKNMLKEDVLEKTFSKDEAIKMVKEMLMDKSDKYKDYTPEELEKGVRESFGKGLSILAMLHGVQSFSANDIKEKQLSPAEHISQQAEIKGASDAAYKDANNIAARNEKGFKGKKINNFLKGISMNESSGGKNLDHEEMSSGIHAGDSAIGQYGLMPNTIKETVGRMGRSHPLHAQYRNMPNEDVANSIKKNPEHEKEIAGHLANRLHDKFGGDESKMSYSWNQGHNLTNDHFADSHKEYKAHPYVQKYHENRKNIEKTPNIPEQSRDNYPE